LRVFTFVVYKKCLLFFLCIFSRVFCPIKYPFITRVKKWKNAIFSLHQKWPEYWIFIPNQNALLAAKFFNLQLDENYKKFTTFKFRLSQPKPIHTGTFPAKYKTFFHFSTVPRLYFWLGQLYYKVDGKHSDLKCYRCLIVPCWVDFYLYSTVVMFC